MSLAFKKIKPGVLESNKAVISCKFLILGIFYVLTNTKVICQVLLVLSHVIRKRCGKYSLFSSPFLNFKMCVFALWYKVLYPTVCSCGSSNVVHKFVVFRHYIDYSEKLDGFNVWYQHIFHCENEAHG